MRADITREACEALVAGGLTVVQAAERLGCSRDTVASRLGLKPLLLRSDEPRLADERCRRETLARRIAGETAAPPVIHEPPRRGIRHLARRELDRYATLGAGGPRDETAGTTWGPLTRAETEAVERRRAVASRAGA